ncbi:MAG: hypothetical protein AMXMBFR59_12750 [Rhodanobacteraceae bacterium]
MVKPQLAPGAENGVGDALESHCGFLGPKFGQNGAERRLALDEKKGGARMLARGSHPLLHPRPGRANARVFLCAEFLEHQGEPGSNASDG